MRITLREIITCAMIIPKQQTDSRAIHPDRRSDRSRWVALVVVCLGQLMSLLDSTIVNVALPSIQRDLHFSQANLTWVLNGSGTGASCCWPADSAT